MSQCECDPKSLKTGLLLEQCKISSAISPSPSNWPIIARVGRVLEYWYLFVLNLLHSLHFSKVAQFVSKNPIFSTTLLYYLLLLGGIIKPHIYYHDFCIPCDKLTILIHYLYIQMAALYTDCLDLLVPYPIKSLQHMTFFYQIIV